MCFRPSALVGKDGQTIPGKIKCPSCGIEIDSQAKECVYCKTPISSEMPQQHDKIL